MGSVSSERLESCENFDPDYMWWYGDHVESQLVVSEAAANCIAEQVSLSPLGRFYMN